LSTRLGELAGAIGAELHGDPDIVIDGVGTLQGAKPGQLSFLSNSAYRKYLKDTAASAVILSEDAAPECGVAALITDNPYLAYARAATRLFPTERPNAGIDESAVVAASAQIDERASIAAGCVVGERVRVGAEAVIGPGSVIENDCEIGAQTRLVARVTLCRQTRIGSRCLIHPGAVVGADGFGLANDQGRWIKVPQLGRVWVGDDVEIGANTTIDRGALRDTVIGNGVKLDNQIQIAHNVEIGDNTAIAACTGIAGSTKIGKQSTIGGGVVVVGHLEFADNVHFSAESLVTRSFSEPGYYSGNLPAMPNREWRKTIAHLRHLDDMAKRIKELEKRISELSDDQSDT
jgi:UDP-3-O-[3-hydroxymyristoyl] glucosamine N-acyltransferase